MQSPFRTAPWRWSIIVLFLATLALATSGLLYADDGADHELWVLAQDASQIKIVREDGASVETLELPAGTQPHLIEFSPSGQYAYVAGLGTGDGLVIRASDRQLIATLDFDTANTHHLMPSPDGSVLLAAQRSTKEVVRVRADEANESWVEEARVTLPDAPECSAFSPDGQRAYVSMTAGNLVVLDVAAMSILETIPTDGKVGCGFAPSSNPPHIYITANGSGGRVYLLDTTTDTLTDLGYTLDAQDLHVPALNSDESVIHLTDRGGDQLFSVVLDTSTVTVTPLDPTIGSTSDDKPDGIVVTDEMIYVALRASGKLAMLPPDTMVPTYLDLVAPSSTALPHLALRPHVMPASVTLSELGNAARPDWKLPAALLAGCLIGVALGRWKQRR